MNDLETLLQKIIDSYFSNEYPGYFQSDVGELFEQIGITKYTKIVRRRGTWSKKHKGFRTCSVCKNHVLTNDIAGIITYKYCPYCGSKMDNGE